MAAKRGWILLTALALPLAAAESTVQAGSELARKATAERAPGVQRLFASATLVEWPAATLGAAEAVALLDRSGNPTTLAAGAGGDRRVALRAFSGDYWQAVLTILDAFALDLEPGARVAGTWTRPGSIDAAGGPLVLVDRRRPPLRRAASGPLLVELSELAASSRVGAGGQSRWVDLTVRLRFEPHLAAERVGSMQLGWRMAETPDHRPLTWKESGGSLRLDDVAGGVFSLIGNLQIEAIEPIRVTAAAHPGDALRIDLGVTALDLALLDDERAKAQNRQAGGLLLSFPPGVLAREPRLGLALRGKELATQGVPPQPDRRDRIERLWLFPALADAEYSLALESALALGIATVPVAATVDLRGLPDDPAPPDDPAAVMQLPTPVEWPAGPMTLQEALRRLEVAGNGAVLDLGVDGEARRELPALPHGTFWQAVLLVADAFDLAIQPPATVTAANAGPVAAMRMQLQAQGQAQENSDGLAPVAVGSGPLRLGRRPAGARPANEVFHADGPLLAEVVESSTTDIRRPAGRQTLIEGRLRLRLEPRFAEGSFGEPWAMLATLADTADGRSFALARTRGLEVGEDGAAGFAALATGLDRAPAALRLHGQLQLLVRRTVRVEAALAPEERASLTLGQRPITLALVAHDPAGHAGLRVSVPAHAFEQVMVEVRDPSGKPLPVAAHAENNAGDGQETLWTLPALEQGRHTVTVVARQVLAQPCLPFTAVLPPTKAGAVEAGAPAP